MFFPRQTDNYPADVAALSKKMVQATLEIYKNTLWGSDVEIEIYTLVILTSSMDADRTPPFLRMDLNGIYSWWILHSTGSMA